MSRAKRPRRLLTIRSAILRGSLILVLLAVLLSGALSFLEFRNALQAEIARNLGNSAGALQTRIDAFIAERIEDLREWHRLELLQDIRVGDVDQRLARLLTDLKTGHGEVYSALYCVDLNGRVVAASDAALVGWIRLPGEIMVGRRDEAVAMERTPGGPGYTLRAEVADAFGSGRIGYLYAVLNWQAVERFLRDDVAASSRSALLLDAGDQVIAAAGGLAPRAGVLRLVGWHGGGAETGSTTRDGAPLAHGRLLVGTATSHGFQHFAGFGWHTLVVESTTVAFAPVWRLTWAMLAGLVFTMLLAGWLSLRLSARIARPLARLTAFARRFREERSGTLPQIATGISEVGELSRAFAEMIQALEASREQLVRAGKLAVVGEMAAIMAHEVRTPLGILKTSAQLLERRVGDAPEVRELVGYIVSETERLNRLVTTLLECASPRPPQFQPHDLHGIIEHVLALVGSRAQKQAIHLEAGLEAHDSLFDCDREQLTQVFLNLIINAIQHVPAQGHIRVSSQDAEGALEVRIEDDGPGIAASEVAKVFDPFYTRREGGVGLGLTIVQQIVQAHGGSIAVGSCELGGAAFTLRFNRLEEQGART